MKWRVFLFLLGLLLLSPIPSTHAGNFLSRTYNGRPYKLYVPSSYDGQTAVPLVVMLHGCTQDPDQFATGTQMNAQADNNGFLVMYPAQTSTANSSQCWNWFETAHQSRGAGEPALIAGMVNHVKSSYAINNDRVYVTGFSAGGAMSAIMGATYPDIFAAIGVASGLEYKAATNSTNAWTAMFNGGPNANTQGNLAYNAMGSNARVVPTIVFHGTSDYTVATINGDLVLSQWAQTNDRADDGSDNNSINDTADQTINGTVPGGRSYTRSLYEDGNGQTIMEKYMVTSMGHAWSGGSSSGSYTDPNGPDASASMVAFFNAHSMNGGTDTTPPTTTASPSGGTYTGSVNVTLSTNETANTYYTTNGSTPTTSSPQYGSPINISSNTTLKFFSVDGSNNSESVKTETYTINDPVPDTTPPTTTASPAGGSYEDEVTVTLSVNESATTYYTTDGSTPTTGSAQYTAPLVFTADTTLKFFSVDVANNTEAVKTESYTITSSPETTVTITSIGSEDGYAGLFWADGYSNSNHKLGDKGMFNSDTYRLILSFDTSVIPAGATITSVEVQVYQQSSSGTMNNIAIWAKNGTFGSASLAQSDYSASASSNWGTFSPPAGNGQMASWAIGSSGWSTINTNGKTQLRLQASTSLNFASDTITLYGGENSTYAPVLVITYE